MFSHLKNFYNSKTSARGEGYGQSALLSPLSIKIIPKFCFDLILRKAVCGTLSLPERMQSPLELTLSSYLSDTQLSCQLLCKGGYHFVFWCQVLLDSLFKSQDSLMETKQQDVPCDRIALSLRAL